MTLMNTLLGIAGLLVLVVVLPFTRRRIASFLTGLTGTWVGTVRIERQADRS
jgi:hypothetical protein